MRVRITISLLFLIIKLSAQVPVPGLCAVSVDTVYNRPVLYWTMSDTSGIDGFIIKRIIWNGTGVLDGTLNNVAVIPDPTARSFLDTTATYNTHASPGQRSEQYVVVAYRDTAGNQIYSGFSQMLSSVYLRAEYDSCSTKIKLLWTTNQQIDRYIVYQITPQGPRRLITTADTQFVYNPLLPGYYRFIVKAVLSNTCPVDTIQSNIAWAQTGLFERPNLLYIQGVNPLGEDSLSLRLYIDLPPDKPNVGLWMDGNLIGNFSSDFEGDYVVNAKSTAYHSFILKAQSVCGDFIDSSNTAHNIVLSGQYIQDGQRAQVNLNWNKYDYCAGVVGTYDIYFSTDGQNYLMLTANNDTIYSHLLNSLISTETLPSTLYYYIMASEYNDTLVNQTLDVKSNILEITPPPLLFVPNAINPLSAEEQDRVFRINLDFIDSYEITVFDRYGRVMFHSINPAIGWDGRGKDGKLVPVDTYFYLLKYESHGRKYKFRGSISVIY